MRIFNVFVIAAVFLLYHAEAQTPHTRLEKDYDFGGPGESYYLKTYVDGRYRLVSWVDDYWSDFQYWEPIMSKWCEPFYMTFGSPYTGTDYPGEVELELDCPGYPTDPGDCFVLKNDLMNYTYHVRVQCMDPISTFDKGQPVTGILTGVCVVLAVGLFTTLIGCFCIGCYKSSSEKSSTSMKGVVYPHTSQVYGLQQQQYPQQQYAPPQSYVPAPLQQQPPPQVLYPPTQPAYPPASNPTPLLDGLTPSKSVASGAEESWKL